ncbi:Uncharacterised protein [Helicobacter canis]|uniref:Uncharacterized protein n=1 Tax=Helicobacter canis TaxID=29419 RepID=A0A377J5E4_9HELI|nr:Uncharacterised protein [Helicobacter canis]
MCFVAYGLLRFARNDRENNAYTNTARNDSSFSVIASKRDSDCVAIHYYQHLEFLRIDIFDDFFCDVADLLRDVISMVGNGGILLCGAFNLRDRLIDLC